VRELGLEHRLPKPRRGDAPHLSGTVHTAARSDAPITLHHLSAKSLPAQRRQRTRANGQIFAVGRARDAAMVQTDPATVSQIQQALNLT
jgi:hypothetical protein